MLSRSLDKNAQGWTNLPLRAQFFGRARSGTQRKTDAQNQSQCVRLIKKQLETIVFVLCYLNRACRFHFYCNSIKNFCNGAFAVLMLFEYLKFLYKFSIKSSQRIILILQTHLSKGVQKNMLKAWNFTNYKFCHRSFDNSLQKISKQIFLRATPRRYFWWLFQ